MVAVKYNDLSMAFDFVGSAAPMEHNAYISLDTGEIYWTSELNPMDEEVPADLEASDRYIAMPHKNDLDLGRNLALRFAAQELPKSYELVEGFFRRKGAYSRFKQLLESERVLEKWYKFEMEAVEKALRDWCAECDIQIVEDGEKSST